MVFLKKWKGYILRNKIKSSILLLVLVVYYFCLPKDLFADSYSTIVESKEGLLLGAKIANDGQWRFPERDSIPFKLEKAMTLYEDAHFYQHWGINPVSMSKAFVKNLKKGKIVRGGSTITQQVIRLSRKNKARTYFEKAIEGILATRLEFRYSKKKILALYASHAPFGGNIVGVDMAAWRYFGISPEKLSWAEASLLAILPNAPGVVYPGKNQQNLIKKRNFLLKKLLEKQIIDQTTYELSLLEELPQKPHDLPQIAPHLVERIAKEKNGQSIRTTINYDLQNKVNKIVERHYNIYKQLEVHNACVLIADVETKNIIAYVGNTPTDYDHQRNVNIIHRPRSTGSILKPFLYASALDSGELLPQEIIADVPTLISGYKPENFGNTYEGAVPADEALYRSLNIPFVLLLQKYGVARFYQQLKKLKLSNIKKHPDHYGLSLVLGGAESNLYDLCQAYTTMAFELNYFQKKSMYLEKAFQPLHYYPQEKSTDYGKEQVEKNLFSAGAIYKTLEALTQVNRPAYDSAWKYYDSAQKISWKTGTSFGNRDAWAIGITPKYVVGVWVGNASGEGRPELTGVTNAAPIMFEIFHFLPKSKGFTPPYDDLKPIEVCENSGLLASDICPKKTIYNVALSSQNEVCTYHKWVHLTSDKRYQVHTDCENLSDIVSESRFVLPPLMEWFYKKSHTNYIPLPPFRQDCLQADKVSTIDFIYPKHGNIIYQTKGFGGKLQPIVCRVATSGNGRIFWYLDNTFLGETLHFHDMPIHTTEGEHFLKCIDEQGNEKTIKIMIATE
ncbi:MAG: penicillin-binding protein 1C [Capnocytophaga sp.]|nr:penicillin-binding protein 1C [Capnocytophaga sp.]